MTFCQAKIFKLLANLWCALQLFKCYLYRK